MPAHGPRNSEGRNCSATVMPTAVTEPESWSTSQSWAIRCIQSAITAMKCPIAKMRKLRTFSEMKVWRQGRRSLTTAMGWVWVMVVRSMTGRLTVASNGGGGATESPQGSG